MAGKHQGRSTRQDSLTCKTATSLIARYLIADLDSKTELSFEDHLRVCPDCVAFLNTYKKTLELTRSFLAMEVADPGLKKLRSQILKKVPKPRVRG